MTIRPVMLCRRPFAIEVSWRRLGNYNMLYLSYEIDYQASDFTNPLKLYTLHSSERHACVVQEGSGELRARRSLMPVRRNG